MQPDIHGLQQPDHSLSIRLGGKEVCVLPDHAKVTVEDIERLCRVIYKLGFATGYVNKPLLPPCL